jgi:predicted TPR repeat methyltransferase
MGFVSSGWGRESYAEELRRRLEKKGLKVLKTISLTLRQIDGAQLRGITEILESIS